MYEKGNRMQQKMEFLVLKTVFFHVGARFYTFLYRKVSKALGKALGKALVRH